MKRIDPRFSDDSAATIIEQEELAEDRRQRTLAAALARATAREEGKEDTQADTDFFAAIAQIDQDRQAAQQKFEYLTRLRFKRD